MVLPAILHAFHPTTLQVLCAVGFFHGISLFVYTIRQRRRLAHAAILVAKRPNLKRDLIPNHSTRLRARSVQVIRLSPESGAEKLSNMTQQQKIAAALLKAGSAHSPSWYDPDSDTCGSGSPAQVITAPPPTSADEEANDRPCPHRDASAQPRWKINLMFSVSAVLTTLSLYVLLKSLR